MEIFRRFLPFAFFILFIGCSKKKPALTVERSYFYWRTSSATESERQFLKQNDIRKLYVRVLDVDWSDSQGAIPVANFQAEQLAYPLKRIDSFPVEVTPVVFITNKTMTRISKRELDELATRIVRRCLPNFDQTDEEFERKRVYEYGKPLQVKEILLDCDWTNKTAENYFELLRRIDSKLQSDSILLSATIRLHQYKYFEKTGVPPVDRGMLMVYNTSNPQDFKMENSIFDPEIARQYFKTDKPYPVPLDMALPAWSWCLIFRDQKFYQIENGLDEQDLKSLSFLQHKKANIYTVTQDTVYRNLFLRPGDEIRAETIGKKTLLAAAKLATKAINTSKYSVALFELSGKEIKNYNDETLDQVYSTFQ